MEFRTQPIFLAEFSDFLGSRHNYEVAKQLVEITEIHCPWLRNSPEYNPMHNPVVGVTF